MRHPKVEHEAQARVFCGPHWVGVEFGYDGGCSGVEFLDGSFGGVLGDETVDLVEGVGHAGVLFVGFLEVLVGSDDVGALKVFKFVVVGNHEVVAGAAVGAHEEKELREHAGAGVVVA